MTHRLFAGLMLVGVLTADLLAQPYSAQIQSALRSIGFTGAPGVFTGSLKGPVGCDLGFITYAFNGDTDTGMCRPEPKQLEWVVDGRPIINIQDTGTSQPVFYLLRDVVDLGNFSALLFAGSGTNPFLIASTALGSGVQRALSVSGSAGTGGLTFLTTGHVVPIGDAATNLGADGGPRFLDVYFAGRIASNNCPTVTLDAATQIVAATSCIVLQCTGVETVNTIVGGILGSTLKIYHGDTECTIASDADPTAANAVALDAADVGAVNKILVLEFGPGGYWLKAYESDNQ